MSNPTSVHPEPLDSYGQASEGSERESDRISALPVAALPITKTKNSGKQRNQTSLGASINSYTPGSPGPLRTGSPGNVPMSLSSPGAAGSPGISTVDLERTAANRRTRATVGSQPVELKTLRRGSAAVVVNGRASPANLADSPSHASRERFEDEEERRSEKESEGPGPMLIESSTSFRGLPYDHYVTLTMREKLYVFLEDETSGRAAFLFGNFITLAILLSILQICVETMDGPNHYEDKNPPQDVGMASLSLPSASTYFIFETIFSLVFTGELVMRLIASSSYFIQYEKPPTAFDKMVGVQIPFFMSYMNWADIFAVAPFYVMLMLGGGEQSEGVEKIVQFTKALRCLRIFKLSRQFEGSEVLFTAISRGLNALSLPLFFFMLFTFVFGALIFFVEPCYNYQECKFKDLFVSCYFATVTMTTVGYGDQYPQTLLSRAVTSIIMMFGSLFLAMPVAILGSEFNDAWSELEVREGKSEEDVIHAEEDLKMKRKRLGVNLLTRLNRANSKISKSAALAMIERVTNKVLGDEEGGGESPTDSPRTPPPAEERISETRFYIYELYLRTSEHLNAAYELMDENKITLDRCDWCVDVVGSCSTLMSKVVQIVNTSNGSESSEGQIKAGVMKAKRKVEPLDQAGNSVSDMDYSMSGGKRAKGRVRKASRMASGIFKGAEGAERSGRYQSGRGSVALPSLGLSETKLMKLQEIHDSRKGPAVGFVTGGINNLLKQGQNISADMQNDEDKNFIKYITDAMYTDSKRDQVWLLLEVPQSSNAARGLSFFMIVVITMSIMVFVMESVPQLVYYGEPTQACQDVTKLYCEDKVNGNYPKMNFDSNIGCYTYNSTKEDSVPLEFNCEHENCFGIGRNFGSGLYVMEDASAAEKVDYMLRKADVPEGTAYHTCKGFAYTDPSDFEPDYEEALRPFARQAQLKRINDFTWLHDNMNEHYDVCFRQECSNEHYLFMDMTTVWLPMEVFFAIVFTLEIVVRCVVSRNILKFWTEPMNLMDLASVSPFYIEVVVSFIEGEKLNFNISSSDSAAILLLKILKVTRVFKMTRHFSGTLVLVDTFKRSITKLSIPFFMLTIMSVVCAVVFFTIESGSECFIMETWEETIENCPQQWPSEIEDNYASGLEEVGFRYLITEYGQAQATDAMAALFYVLVTFTSVGFGDITPQTMMGKSLAFMMMLLGTLYLSMPLTIVGGQFIRSYKNMEETDRLFELAVTNVREISIRETGNDLGLEFARAGKDGKTKVIRDALENLVTNQSFKIDLPAEMLSHLKDYEQAQEALGRDCRELDDTIEKAISLLLGEPGAAEQVAGTSEGGETPRSASEDLIVQAVRKLKATVDRVNISHMQLSPLVRFIDKLLVAEEDLEKLAKGEAGERSP